MQRFGYRTAHAAALSEAVRRAAGADRIESIAGENVGEQNT
jgi:hypothetical protein